MSKNSITPQQLKAFESVLGNDKYMRVCTDLELCHLINKQLDDEQQICYRDFMRYKLMVQEYSYTTTLQYKMKQDYELYRKLYSLWMDARISLKMKLMEFVEGKVAGWQRYRWLLERRFYEFTPNQEMKQEKSNAYQPHMDELNIYYKMTGQA